MSVCVGCVWRVSGRKPKDSQPSLTFYILQTGENMLLLVGPSFHFCLFCLFSSLLLPLYASFVARSTFLPGLEMLGNDDNETRFAGDGWSKGSCREAREHGSRRQPASVPV